MEWRTEIEKTVINKLLPWSNSEDGDTNSFAHYMHNIVFAYIFFLKIMFIHFGRYALLLLLLLLLLYYFPLQNVIFIAFKPNWLEFLIDWASTIASSLKQYIIILYVYGSRFQSYSNIFSNYYYIYFKFHYLLAISSNEFLNIL